MKIKRLKGKSKAQALIAPALVFIFGAALMGFNALGKAKGFRDNGEIEGYLTSMGISPKKIKEVYIIPSRRSGAAPLGCAVSFSAAVVYTDLSGQTLTYISEAVELIVGESSGESDGRALGGYTITYNEGKLTGNKFIFTREGGVSLTACFHNVSEVFEYTVAKYSPDQMGYALLVNKYSTLEEGFSPREIIRPRDILNYYGEQAEASHLEKQAAECLTEMFAAANQAGYELCLLSGYRSYARQSYLYNRAGGKNQTDTAAPGQSEHQTALAADITWGENKGILAVSRQRDAEFKWLTENSWKYGFILRYPKGFEKITGYDFEPWHYRYIGKEAAEKYRLSDCSTLEEFIGSYY
ncbi:MAG: M15 family metallopeptidase [Eubacteriaceae bacterium]|nr:M15 family metallopeptidase [Eubacteriaceae bacterium]